MKSLERLESRENREQRTLGKDQFIRERDEGFESESSKEGYGKSDFDFEKCSRVPT